MKLKLTALTIILSVSSITMAQSKQVQAEKKIVEAIDLMEDGKIKESLKVLEAAEKLDPDNITIPYEMAYAHYLNEDFKNAIKILEKLVKRKDAYDLMYQLLGNSYSLSGNRDKAIKAYEDGLKRFPNSGKLYLERGNMEMFVEKYEDAIKYYEKGILVEPTFPSNYYWASYLYCNSSEEVWGMIYGELFMNLERGSQRTSTVSKLLFDTYKSQINFTSDTSYTVSFSKNATITIEELEDAENFKLPFGIGKYEPLLMMSVLGEKEIDLTSLNKIRTNFLNMYFENGADKDYPNALFDYQKKVRDAGHIEAYNYWILMKGDEEAFGKWHADNTDKWDGFVAWFTENPIKIDKNNNFHRSQY